MNAQSVRNAARITCRDIPVHAQFSLNVVNAGLTNFEKLNQSRSCAYKISIVFSKFPYTFSIKLGLRIGSKAYSHQAHKDIAFDYTKVY